MQIWFIRKSDTVITHSLRNTKCTRILITIFTKHRSDSTANGSIYVSVI